MESLTGKQDFYQFQTEFMLRESKVLEKVETVTKCIATNVKDVHAKHFYFKNLLKFLIELSYNRDSRIEFP